MSSTKVPLKIVQTDLVGDCARLNRRFDMVEQRVATVGTQVNNITQNIINPTIIGSSSISTHVVLTANATIASPGVPLDGALWTLRIDQDATGGWQVFWGASVNLGPDINATVNSDPSTMCLMIFAGFGGAWYLVAQPILGVRIV